MEKENIRNIVAQEIASFETARPQATKDIGAVWVFSGPGTFLSPLKGRDEDWMAWMNHLRLSTGILLVLQVTSLTLNKSIQEVTKNDVERSGPPLIYNGIPIENDDFRSVINLPQFPLPKGKIIIIDEVEKNGIKSKIRNTREQVMSFPRQLLGNPISGAIALVSHATHLPRILRYMNKYRTIPNNRFPIRCFPIHSDPKWAAIDASREIEDVCRYLAMGHLSENPYPPDLGLT